MIELKKGIFMGPPRHMYERSMEIPSGPGCGVIVTVDSMLKRISARFPMLPPPISDRAHLLEPLRDTQGVVVTVTSVTSAGQTLGEWPLQLLLDAHPEGHSILESIPLASCDGIGLSVRDPEWGECVGVLLYLTFLCVEEERRR